MHLEQKRPSPFSFLPKPVHQVIDDFLEHCKLAKGLRIRSLRRYETALKHFRDFTESKPGLRNIDQVKESTVDEFVRYMHRRKRVRSGTKKGTKGKYTASGIAFILSTCRTLFNYARKRRLLSPYEDNPFTSFPIEKLRSREPSSVKLLTRENLSDFFATCDTWQFPVLLFLCIYGLRTGELTHILISDVDLDGERFFIRSKPFLQWYTKTNRELILPILPMVRPVLDGLMADRPEGFLFISRAHWDGRRDTPSFTNRNELEMHITSELEEYHRQNPEHTDLAQYNYLQRILNKSGRLRGDRVREEFMQIARKIDHPEITSVHSLRHLFATLAEEGGLNSLTVQTILGHSRLDMTRYYTHTGLEAKKNALEDFLRGKSRLDQILKQRIPDG